MNTIYVITTTRRGGSPNIKAAYTTWNSARARVNRIEKANAPYLLRPVGPNVWEIGPDEDEGFFGHQPVVVAITETRLFDE